MKTLLALLLLSGMAMSQTPKFNVGNKVYVTHTNKVGVRAQPTVNSALLGTQPNGRTGIVKAGPITGPTGDGRIRYQIDYAIGVDGWSVQEYLEKSKIQPPPPPTLTVSPASLSFTTFVGADSDIKLVTVTNSGTTAVAQVGSVSGAGFQYGGTGTCGSLLNQGTCTISVKCHPTVAGTSTGVLTIAPGVPTVPLSCVATAPTVHDVELKWDASVPDATHTGVAATYNLYRKTGTGSYAKVGSVTASVLTFTDTPVPSGTYQYMARSVMANGGESADSIPVTVTIP